MVTYFMGGCATSGRGLGASTAVGSSTMVLRRVNFANSLPEAGDEGEVGLLLLLSTLSAAF